MGRHIFHETAASSDSKRILEVADGDIRAAKRLLSLVAEIDQQATKNPLSAGIDPQPSRAEMFRSLARKEFDNRRSRKRVFGTAMFGEPAWDMLLTLYINDNSGPRQTLGTLLQFSGSSPSTSKRWMEFLESSDLVTREPHPLDARTYFVMLTDKARGMIDTYLSGTIDTPL